MGPHIGDIYELQIPDGLAYVQFIGEVKDHGSLFRVLDGQYIQSQNEKSLGHIAQRPHQFFTFFPYIGARRQGLARLVAKVPVPADSVDIPPIITDQRDLTGMFYIDFPDGRPTLALSELTEEQKLYPTASVPAADLLGERIASGWRPRDQYESRWWKERETR